MRIGLMIEGQAGLTWERWRQILRTAERLGIPTVFRSDHYHTGRQTNALESYLSFVMAAEETSTIRFGSLVTPMTFRSPVDVGRMAAQISHLSRGRFVLGLGAGDIPAEHETYGLNFPSVRERIDRLEEGIQVIRTLWGPGPASYQGKYYKLHEVDCLPKPTEGIDAPLLIGGNGEKRMLPMAVKYASEWNCMPMTLDVYRKKAQVVNQLCEDAGRDPKGLQRSMMSFGLVAHNQHMLDRITRRQMQAYGATGAHAAFRDRLSGRGQFICGLTNEVADLLLQYAQAGMDEVEFEQFNFDSDEIPAYLATELAPLVA